MFPQNWSKETSFSSLMKFTFSLKFLLEVHWNIDYMIQVSDIQLHGLDELHCALTPQSKDIKTKQDYVEVLQEVKELIKKQKKRRTTQVE